MSLRVAVVALAAWSGAALGLNDTEIERAVIQRDQQSAQFAAQVRSGVSARIELEQLHARQLTELGRPHLQPFDRVRSAQETDGFVLRLPPPRVQSREKPGAGVLPLPGGPRPGVDPVLPAGVGD